MTPMFHGTVLSSGRVLRSYLTREDVSFADIRRAVFLEERTANPSWPDHVFRGHWDRTCGTAGDVGGLLLSVMEQIAEDCFDLRHTRLGIRREAFGGWQELITRVSPLLLVTYGLWRAFGRHVTAPTPQVLGLLRAGLMPSTLPLPFDAALEDMIAQDGLYDLHVHLNGTTEADIVRLDALARPLETLRLLKEGFGNRRGAQPVPEQYDQIEEGLTPDRLVRRLRFAAHLRRVLADDVMEKGNEERILPPLRLAVEDGAFLPHRAWQANRRHPVRRHGVPDGTPDTVCEGLFLWRCFDHLAAGVPEAFHRALHVYLLIGSLHQRFVVQQVDQKGFDQFQKITVNEFRTASERTYERRFDQLARTEQGELAFLEGRFAPKATYAENLRLLSTILKGYARHHAMGRAAGQPPGESRRLRLGLVAHFIKRPDAGRGRGIVRHAALRRDAERQAVALVQVCRRSPKLRRFLVGADAAANELHAGPEVFAPAFRRLRHAGWTNFTYHAGEDFRHLLSGIRAVMEAIHFLDLRSDNRIGHATALGVEPELWSRRTGGRWVLGRGEWLDDLVFAYRHLSATAEGQIFLMPLRDAIGRLARRVYGDAGRWDPDILARAWALRGLDPRLACDPGRRRRDAVSCFRQEEWERVERARDEDPDAFALFQAYHSPAVRHAGGQLEEVTAADLPEAALALVQRVALAEVVARGVVLEAMPTSNLRIGVYHDRTEHHLGRWLGVTGDLPRPRVVVASDDPGIFANCLYGDLCHVLDILRAAPDVDDARAAAILRNLNRTARTTRFQPPAQPLHR